MLTIKLIEKVLANRLDVLLDEIIHKDQSGFMAGRRICSNIQKVYDVMQYCKINDIPGVILNLDFVKCFNMISSEGILGSLKFFGIPEFMQNWIKILYNDFKIRVQNNGKFTNDIPVERSVHQGGCVSVQLFLLCAEIIAIELRQCEKIRRLPVNDIIYLLNQYADDMNVSSLFKKESVDHIFEKLEWFKRNTGFTLSYKKTSMYRMGSIHDTEAEFYTQNQIKWTNELINILGVSVNYGDSNTLSNYDPIIGKVKLTLSAWKNRGLSLMGKINVINTLVGSLFVYKMMVLPVIPDSIVRRVETEMVNFIWNVGKSKISTENIAVEQEIPWLKPNQS